MLADDSIDAVEILTPTHLHHDHVIAALEAGKHVSVQKPVANSVDDGLEMEAAAEKAGRTLRISECFVHYPPLELAKKLVADGAIGKPTSLRIRTLVGQTDSPFQASLRPEGYGWRLDKRSAGGHLFDDMVHKYAMALWLLDQDITSVQAVVRRRDLFFEPCAVIFEYEDPEVLGMMEVQYAPNFYMRSSYYGADEFFEITGDEGQIWVTRATGEMLDLAPVMLFTGTPQRAQDHRVHRPRRRLGHRDSSARPSTSSTRSSTARRPPCRAAEATEVLQLCFAVYQAAEIRRPVDPRTITGSVSPAGLGRLVDRPSRTSPTAGPHMTDARRALRHRATWRSESTFRVPRPPGRPGRAGLITSTGRRPRPQSTPRYPSVQGGHGLGGPVGSAPPSTGSARDPDHRDALVPVRPHVGCEEHPDEAARVTYRLGLVAAQ